MLFTLSSSSFCSFLTLRLFCLWIPRVVDPGIPGGMGQRGTCWTGSNGGTRAAEWQSVNPRAKAGVVRGYGLRSSEIWCPSRCRLDSQFR
ncbi:hypothetical protein SODALDRAFT_327757 [Sodiomyces alkalinus F11]|uniref:Secreted protein n=1 Tax=Sodiomyces alkalinus (strain CBS 110278 / VKM F-3762 / F11) TaxID=1314773 RepID=A0A3N2Q9Z1_SODAK|nr:hypothetical protein SODALDRAFT_327757 [Sodiomyces alkalinus F11]ROT43556.1 hypothetical protein SODALDRAFT_327757 [Sodiomyces alkalinus F11]